MGDFLHLDMHCPPATTVLDVSFEDSRDVRIDALTLRLEHLERECVRLEDEARQARSHASTLEARLASTFLL